MSIFSRRKSNFFQISVHGTHLAEPNKVAQTFSSHFKSVYTNTDSVCQSVSITYFGPSSLHNLSKFPVIDENVRQAIREAKFI